MQALRRLRPARDRRAGSPRGAGAVTHSHTIPVAGQTSSRQEFPHANGDWFECRRRAVRVPMTALLRFRRTWFWLSQWRLTNRGLFELRRLELDRPRLRADDCE